MNFKVLIRLYLIFIPILTYGSNNPVAPKSTEAKRSNQKVTLDGIIGEEEWSDASILDKFVQLRPTPFKHEDESSRTVTYLKYDNEGIYFGGKMFENSKDSIAKELVGRDRFGNNDFVGIIFDTYKDNLNAFEYFVTPLNEQMDAKNSPSNNGNDEDFSWDAVWQSNTKIHDWGWSFEMFIPYAAIRFPNNAVQDWGINIVRRRQKTGEQFFWNSIDPNVNGFLTQEGYWTGIKDIKPPVRLQLSPYLSYYANHFPARSEGVKDFNNQVNGGLDLKWGINQAFTLDATLIPDFGQVQSDPRVLNLTPFEVQFNEYRPFFTEGTDLFSKGNLFYSRRIGGTPINFYSAENQIQPNESLISNPSETRLINASKISGRTSNGLGIGILNAISNGSNATILNHETGESRQVETAPLTNYNVFVANKSLKYNSSVSLVNTNVLRFGDTYDANVSALLFDFNNKANKWNAGGQINTSTLTKQSENNNSYGYSHSLYAGKTNGEFLFNVFNEVADTKYNSNDMGYFTNNNYINQGFWIGIRKNTPNNWRNHFRINFNGFISYLFRPIGVDNPNFQSGRFNVNSNMQLKSLHYMGFFGDFRPHSNDFYEPRVFGKFFRSGASHMVGAWVETNRAKKIFLVSEVAYRRTINFYNGHFLDVMFRPTWRASERLSLGLGLSWQPRFNNIGFIAFNNQQPVFSKRNIQTFENTINAKYTFTNRMGLNLVLRHYLRGIENLQTFDLQDNGRIKENNLVSSTFDRTVNYFNIDLVYTWQIAQGSFVNIVWKNAINSFNQGFSSDYFSNLNSTITHDQNNNLSVKFIYFLDYHTLFGK
jgi:hypothetical protein